MSKQLAAIVSAVCILMPLETASALEPGFVFFTNKYTLSSFNGIDGLLVGTNGFRLVGEGEENQFGSSLSAAGDFNGDGRADMIVGAPFYDETGNRFRAGRAYIVYGKAAYLPSQQIPGLGVSGRLQITGGATDDRKGYAVSGGGDFNGDGFDDVIVGAPFADPSAKNEAGKAYVVFGGTNLGLTIDVSGINGTNGFAIEGPAAGNRLGNAVSLSGDINGDGLADVLIGAENAAAETGKVFIIFGTTNALISLDVSALDGTNGVVVVGEDVSDHAGHSLAGIGDFNGDSLADLVVGAHTAPDFWQAGRVYVVFGRTNWSALVSLSELDGTNGLRIDGNQIFGALGSAVSGGDLNGDGYGDVVVGAPPLNSVYTVFGPGMSGPVFSVTNLNGANGFTAAYTNSSVSFGSSVSVAENINADPFGDLIVGAPALAPGGLTSAGGLFVIMGREVFPAIQNATALDGTNGFVMNGVQSFAEAGKNVAAIGDMNGDSITEFAAGAYKFDYSVPGTNTVLTNAGCAYVVSPPGIPNVILFKPEISSISSTGTTRYVSWDGQNGVTYSVFTNADLNSGTWGVAATIVSTNATPTWQQTDVQSQHLFYKLKVTK
ncbi:MAG: FG-GAP repeat protein [Verrucomicrobia bacterium]|nr:FG-GAP repeat protein [Verrucomicrobiota bacterium]